MESHEVDADPLDRAHAFPGHPDGAVLEVEVPQVRAAAGVDAFVVHRQPEPSRMPANLRASPLVKDGATDGMHPRLLAEVDGTLREVDEGGGTARHLSDTRHGHAEHFRTAKVPVLDQDDVRDLVHELLGHRRTRVAGVEDRTPLPELLPEERAARTAGFPLHRAGRGAESDRLRMPGDVSGNLRGVEDHAGRGLFGPLHAVDDLVGGVFQDGRVPPVVPHRLVETPEEPVAVVRPAPGINDHVVVWVQHCVRKAEDIRMLGVRARVLQHPAGEVDVLGPAVMDFDVLVLGREGRYEYFADLHVLVRHISSPATRPVANNHERRPASPWRRPFSARAGRPFPLHATKVMISSPPFDTK